MIETVFAVATDSTGTIVVVVGAFVTIIGGFGAIARVMLSQASKDREADRAERIRLAEAIEHMANSNADIAMSNQVIANSVDKQSAESAERNGHIAEISSKSLAIATKTLTRLEKSETALQKDNKAKAKAVAHVKIDLEEHTPVKVVED